MNNRWKVHMKVVSLEDILNHPAMAALTHTETNKNILMTILQVRVDSLGQVNFSVVLLTLHSSY